MHHGVIAGFHRGDFELDDFRLGPTHGVSVRCLSSTDRTKHSRVCVGIDLLSLGQAFSRFDAGLRIELRNGNLTLGVHNLGLRGGECEYQSQCYVFHVVVPFVVARIKQSVSNSIAATVPRTRSSCGGKKPTTGMRNKLASSVFDP